MYRVGFIWTAASDEVTHFRKAFEEGLRDLGYVEGRDLVFERRFAEGKQERLPALAAELVRLNVDVIVTGSNPVIAAVKQATTRIPVVMAVSRDPVGLGVTFQPVRVRGRDEFEGAFAAMLRERADALLVAQDPILLSARGQVVLLATRHRLPAVYGNREYTEVGGLMSYGPNVAHQFRRAAGYVDKILKGAKPADLPVEQPTTFELVINLKTANALRLTMPASLLARADEVLR